MKLRHLLFAFAVMSTSLIGCNNHAHKWQNIKKPDYVAGRATFTHGTRYYKSCPECGAVSKETFDDDDKLTYTVADSVTEKDRQGMIDVLGGRDIIGFFIAKDELFRKYTIHYDTYNLKNERITLSAAVVVPFVDYGAEPNIKGFVIDHHPTITDKNAAPTLKWTEMTLNVVAECVVLQPDLIGLGLTADQTLDYHCHHLSDRNAMDAALATQQFIKNKFNVDIANLKTFNVGYSQGGYDSLSFLRYMEQEATEEEKSVIHIDETYSGAGAYNIQTMFDKSLENEKYEYIEFILMGVMSTHEYHPECYTKDVADYLTPTGKELLTVLNKKSDTELANFKQSHKHEPHSIFVSEYLDDKTSEWSMSVARAAAKENLLDGNWKPTGKLWLFYPVNDDMVTTECSKQAIELFKDLDNVETYVDDASDTHHAAGTPFYVFTFIDILKKLADI